MGPRKKKRPPIDRHALQRLFAPQIKCGLVTENDLDRWTAKLDAIDDQHQKGRCVMVILESVTDRMNTQTAKQMKIVAARRPSEN